MAAQEDIMSHSLKVEGTHEPPINQVQVDGEEELQEEELLTLTDLPEVALVRVMEYLNLKERYYLSLTCHLFYDLFSHPKLWQAAHISLMPVGHVGRNRLRWKLVSVMHQTMGEIVKRFSHLFQHLTLQMSGYVQKFDANCLQMLEDLNIECRLESLTLIMGSLTSKDDSVRREAEIYSNIKDIPLVVGLVRNAVRLKQLNLISWPLFKELSDSSDIFQAIVENSKLQSVESFNFFFLNKREGSWTERIPQLPSPETATRVISSLINLQHLALRSPMLSDDLLVMLASRRRRKLESLQILVMFSHDSMYVDGLKIPDISSSAWAALKTASPNLKVECFVVTRMPEEQLSLMLNQELPLHALSIRNYGRCDGVLIRSLAEKFHATLRKFVSLCDSSDCDESLLYLVDHCKHLRHVTYHGQLSHRTVVKISELIKKKGQGWECLEVQEKSIKTDDVAEDEDEDLAVARDAKSQEYYIVSLRRWHEDGDDRQKKLDRMVEVVSENLGFAWRPV
ncbi:uncharacterized protein LOC101862345 [Aplysia californica]|uniref:Uncharacterized protein LOC101862345 n=1 Tax=Aplysia californica TaxID=6500 RepID=A0ABM0JN42_APLCA|nr:uncharacterized protein LOC101862345 [Aplysia californica]XP_012937481.1 uncharacterized protein LOC101862345 [Aplysia californica]XP_012937482.1 uncharacterized protein LOC101862345 [Aplysia californica]